MVLENFLDWYNLLINFPRETLNKIDQLWVKYSNGHFGFSIQSKIYESFCGKSLEEKRYADYHTIKNQFTKVIGWDFETEYRNIKYHSFKFTLEESKRGNLPYCWTRCWLQRNNWTNSQFGNGSMETDGIIFDLPGDGAYKLRGQPPRS